MSATVTPQPSEPMRKGNWPWLRQVLSFIVIVLSLIMLWEGLKLIGGNIWRIGDLTYQPPLKFKITSDLNMPHVWDIGLAFVRPAVRNGPPLFSVLLAAAVYTFWEALAGFLMGAILGLMLGIIFAHVPLLERSLMPYVVASQTIPILAIAPMVVIWFQAGWWSVAIIAAYLTFFPVTINTLRGLRAPNPHDLDLLRAYAASPWQILWKLRLPAALPYIFTALKVSATASVVGAIIGELPSGIRDGLGGAILNFNQYYITSPAKLWATIIMAAFVGIVFFLLTLLTEMIVLKERKGD